MAGPTLGTLLIQRLDAALGTTLSQQSSIVNRATSDAITQPGQPDRLERVANTLIRHPRETVDRLTSGAGSGGRIETQKPATGTPTAADRTTYPGPTTSATTTLGPAARIILALFSNHGGASPPIAGRTPLFATAPGAGAHPGRNATAAQNTTATLNVQGGSIAAIGTDSLSQALTRGLTQALQQSGLFYESHLKEVSQGQYRVADALREPQAQTALQARAGANISSAGTTGASASPGAPPASPMAPASPEPATTAPSTPATTGSAPTGSSPSHTATTPGVDPATHGIVRQQLEALADQTVHWRGEAWPGAELEWQVRRHPEHEDTSTPSADTEASWQSRIRVLLPGLGDITADVRLAGKQIHLTLQADDATAPLLRHHSSELHRQMSDRQLELTAVHFIDPERPES